MSAPSDALTTETVKQVEWLTRYAQILDAADKLLHDIRFCSNPQELWQRIGMSQEVEDLHDRVLYESDAVEVAQLRAQGTPKTEQRIMIDRDADLCRELRAYLDTLTITSDNIGDIRERLLFPWPSQWNAWVRDETAAREGVPPHRPDPQEKDQ